MSPIPAVDFALLPTHCDVSGRVAPAAFVELVQRAFWETFRAGPGIGSFTERGLFPVVRDLALHFYSEVRAGDVLRFEATVTRSGRTSFGIHHVVRRPPERAVLADVETLFVCIDQQGRPQPVPEEVRQFLGTRPSMRGSAVQHLVVRGVATAVDMQGDGPAILFVHGFPLDRTMWQRLTAPLRGFRRIAPDLRGFGLSDVGEQPPSLAVYADDLAALLDLLEVEQAVVCGLSMGGYVAFEFFRRHRNRVRALVLANTRAEADGPEARARRDQMIGLVEQQGVGALVEAMLPQLLAPDSLQTMPAVVEHVRTMIQGATQQGVIAALHAMRDRADAAPLLAEIDVPTLVIAGRDDQLIPPERSKELADRIPQAQYTVIPGAGHLPPVEQPLLTERVIREFLEALS